eukprot:602628_1
MKHFRSLLSLGAIEDDEHIEPFELRRIRSHLPQSTRLSQQRKRQSKQQSTSFRASFRTIDGKKVPELSHSISTKQRRQFFYPNRGKTRKKQKKLEETNEIEEEEEAREEEEHLEQVIELEDEWDGYNELNGESQSHFDEFDLQLPSGMDTFYAFQSPNATPKMHNNQMLMMMMMAQQSKSHSNHMNIDMMKPRLNSKLPSPQYPPSHCIKTKVQLSKLLPPPSHVEHVAPHFKLIPMMSSNSASYTNNNSLPPSAVSSAVQLHQYLPPFHPENSITSIKSESVTLPMTRTSMNSWPSSQQSILNLNNRVSSRSAQIRATEYAQQLSPIYDEESVSNPWKQLTQELTDDDDDGESEIENEIDDTTAAEEEEEDDVDRPRLATIVSQASSVHVPLNADDYNHYVKNHIHATYSFPSSQRTSRTITTTNSTITFEMEEEEEEEEDVNVAFEYIADDEEAAAAQSAPPTTIEAIEAIYMSRGMDVLMRRSFTWYDFEFMDNIGRGAFGVVDKSFHLKSCQIVALKRSRSLKQRMMDSFKREVLICAEFSSCPYIINMIECGIDESKNEICCALEYMNCASLMTRTRYSVNEIRRICFCVLSALCALHSKLYVHNDIKPDNILLNTSGEVKLSDFGCCERMRDEHTPLRRANGSLHYQSYEKKFASPVEYTTQSDIYSFGITCCEILNATHA